MSTTRKPRTPIPAPAPQARTAEDMTFKDMDDTSDASTGVKTEPAAAAPPPRSPSTLPRPSTAKDRLSNPEVKPMSLSKYSKFLLTNAIQKFIDQTTGQNSQFVNRNEERDLFLVSALTQARQDIKKAAAIVHEVLTAAKAPGPTIVLTIDTLCSSVLKQATYAAWLDHNRSLNVEKGLMPDSYFGKLMDNPGRRPAPEVGETDAEDIHATPVDRRDEVDTPPAGLDNDYVEINGFEWQIEGDGLAPLPNRIAEGLEDLRVYLENIRMPYVPADMERLPFFVEQIEGEWVRHNGDVYLALLAYDKKQAQRNRERQLATETAYSLRSRRLLAAT